MEIKLGISPINWCNDDDPNLGKNISFDQMISEMAAAGFVATEIGNKYPRDPVQLKTKLQAQGLQISSAWFSTYFTVPDQYQKTLSTFLDHLSFLRALGARYVNVCECGHAIQQTQLPILGAHKPIFDEHQWLNLIRGLHQMGRIANDFGMQLVYHYHAGTGIFTEQEIVHLLDHTSPQLVGLLLDTGHASFADIDPLNLIKQHGSRIQYVHLKDIRKATLIQTQDQQWNFMEAVRRGVFTVPGDGDINFDPIIKALYEQKYKGWLLVEAEQDPDQAPPLMYAKKAYHYLNKLLQDYYGTA